MTGLGDLYLESAFSFFAGRGKSDYLIIRCLLLYSSSIFLSCLFPLLPVKSGCFSSAEEKKTMARAIKNVLYFSSFSRDLKICIPITPNHKKIVNKSKRCQMPVYAVDSNELIRPAINPAEIKADMTE